MYSKSTIGLYFHIPFCVAKCTYCDFCSYPNFGWLQRLYKQALLRELAKLIESYQFIARTVYFGGGTPTVLPAEYYEQILSVLPSKEQSEEITIEVNPGTIAPDILRTLKKSGINRISLGVQSVNTRELRLLGRIHDYQDVEDGLQLIRNEGFTNVSMDLIFGLPNQTLSQWQHTLEKVLELAPDHLSLYALTLESGTRLYQMVEQGKLDETSLDTAADMYEFSKDRLKVAGYEHYEISNWALPGKRCLHNLTYWNNDPYLGVGAAAWSYWQNVRWGNIKDPEEYVVNCLRDKNIVEERETISQNQEIADTLILGLRLMDGVSRDRFRQRFGMEIEQIYFCEIEHLAQMGLLEVDTERIRLTDRGILLGNEVFQEFLLHEGN